MSIPRLRERAAFSALATHFDAIAARHLRELFDEDAGRGERFTAEGAGLFLDFSKNRVTQETLDLLVALAAGSASTSPRTGRCSMSPCACRARPR